MFQAIMIEKDGDGQRAVLSTLTEDNLPLGDVCIRVQWSTLNYKDALAITGKAPVVRSFPMVPGIDLAGTVITSEHPSWKPGDLVVLNGWGVGERHWGGLAGMARVKGDWLVPLPPQFSPRQAMAIGTAGYTAMLSVLALERHGITPDKGEVVVTGAGGGVGGIAIALLSRLGYQVVAVTGRPQDAARLTALGAHEVMDRARFEVPGKPVTSERWAGAVDAVGGQILANILAGMRYQGVAAACGLAASLSLPTTVAPFILRGVTLAGIDSVYCPQPLRQEAWQRLAKDLDVERLAALAEDIPLREAIPAASRILAGEIKGRLIVGLE